MSIEIKDSIALVTGSNRGIGRAFVEALLKQGAAKVYAAARNTESLVELAAAHPGRVALVTLDVTDIAQVAEVAAQATDATLVINNAGFLAQTDLFADDLSAARNEFEVNYWGSLHVTRAFAPILKQNGGGAIVFIDSVAGLSAFAPLPTYSDSKAATHSLLTASRFLLADQGTLITGVYPGPVDTDMAKGMEMEKASPESIALNVLGALEQGATEVFPDSMSQSFASVYEVGHKEFERRFTQMLQPA